MLVWSNSKEGIVTWASNVDVGEGEVEAAGAGRAVAGTVSGAGGLLALPTLRLATPQVVQAPGENT